MDRRYQVFVSSTYNDLIEERKEATQAILKCNCFPAGMELFPASNKQQWNVIKQVIDDSDFYLLIIAGRYGSLGTDDNGKKVGYTEMEFDYALSQKKPIIVMLHRHPETLPAKLVEKTSSNIKRLARFRNKVMSGRIVAFWENKDQLHSEILNSLHKLIDSTPEAEGWVRANTLLKVAEEKDSNLSEKIAQFAAINTAEARINYLRQLNYAELKKFFKEEKFIENFITLIDSRQSNDIILSAIELIPKYELDYDTKKYFMNTIDIEPIFHAQCVDGKICDSKLSSSVIELLDLLGMYSSYYEKPILNYLQTGNFSESQKEKAIYYIGNCLIRLDKIERENLFKYIKCELINPHRVLSITDLTSLLTLVCYTENEFIEVYNIFMDSDRQVQEKIIHAIFSHCGADLYITTPRIQRMFFDICDKVYSWNDDEMTSDLLLYCLFTRTYDIFTVDEIFDKVGEFNDDVFYMFFWQLAFEEFGRGTEESYSLDSGEKERIVQIIKRRNHPRKEKLLEQFIE